MTESFTAAHKAKGLINHLDADIILRSSDGRDFRVMKVLLSLASPIFKDMFSLPQSPNDMNNAKDDLPIVDLTEDSGTIQNLLAFYYPAIYSRESRTTISDVSALLEAANKYEMKEVLSAGGQWLTKPQFLEQEPLRVYAIACQRGFEAEAVLAVNHTLREPLLKILEGKIYPELKSIDAGKLYAVLLYRKKCAEAAMEVAKNHRWISATHYDIFECRDPDKEDDWTYPFYTTVLTTPSRNHKKGYERQINVHSWWMEYMESTCVALQNSSCGETVKDFDRMSRVLVAADKCTECRLKVAKHFREFVDEFAREVDERIADVSTSLSPLSLGK
jgi:hypothetical protein